MYTHCGVRTYVNISVVHIAARTIALLTHIVHVWDTLLLYLDGFIQSLVAESSVKIRRSGVDRVEVNGRSEVLNCTRIGPDQVLQSTSVYM